MTIKLRPDGPYRSAGSPNLGDPVKVGGPDSRLFHVWARHPDPGYWWVIPTDGGGAVAVHWKQLRLCRNNPPHRRAVS